MNVRCGCSGWFSKGVHHEPQTRSSDNSGPIPEYRLFSDTQPGHLRHDVNRGANDLGWGSSNTPPPTTRIILFEKSFFSILFFCIENMRRDKLLQMRRTFYDGCNDG